MFCLLVFTASTAQADLFNEPGSVVGFNATSQREVGGDKYFDAVTCGTDTASTLAFEKPGEDVTNLLGVPPTSGRNAGFSIAASHRGPILGLVRPGSNSVATQNPEPAAMLLFGTGITAFAALARKRIRRRH
jgi:hypothetical protein